MINKRSKIEKRDNNLSIKKGMSKILLIGILSARLIFLILISLSVIAQADEGGEGGGDGEGNQTQELERRLKNNKYEL